MDDSFVKVPLNVPRLSGFDKSHQNLLTTKVGTITPIMIDELIPGSKVHLKLALSASLPPLASDTFMRCSVKVEAFFCPLRLLSGSYESWFTDVEKRFAPYLSSGGTSVTPSARKGFMPCIGGMDPTGVDSSACNAMAATGGLFDYLGMKTSSSLEFGAGPFSALPPLAYHRVYHDWYRNTLVQSEVFLPPAANNLNANSPAPAPAMAGCSPYLFFQGVSNNAVYGPYYLLSSTSQLQLADGKMLYDLRQRNFGLDYFTTAMPSPQQGTAMTVGFGVDPNGAGDSSHFSIAALRAANSLQQFKERNQLAGALYVEQCRARYGVSPSDGVAQRSLYLGSAEYEVYTKGVYQNSVDYSGSNPGNNPFTSVAAQYGSARAAGNGTLVESFEAKEPGYLLVNATLVPRVTYSSGIHRRFTNYCGAGSISDLAVPILQNVGPQPIYEYELTGNTSGARVFGYTDRYASFKTMEDELHGILRDGQTLQSFALQRSFPYNVNPQINSSFLEIPTTYLDQVSAVTGEVSQYGCWMDCYFDYKVAQPLAKYSLPTLQDPAYEHGRTVVVHKGGNRL